MNKNLLIIGAGVYGLVAKEIAESMGCFEKIAFVDDHAKTTPDGTAVIGTTQDIHDHANQYCNVIVAIGNPNVRLNLLHMLEQDTLLRIVTLISPHAYISPSAKIGKGCIVEPMTVIHTGCVLSKGCIVSAGAVVNHCSMLCDGVHIDCNATVAGYSLVPVGTKVCSCEVFKGIKVDVAILFGNDTNNTHLTITAKIPQSGPIPIDGKEYCFEDGM